MTHTTTAAAAAPLDCAAPAAHTPGLLLDARQRAMLEEMGVRVWWPAALLPDHAALAGTTAPAPAHRPGPAASERALAGARPALPQTQTQTQAQAQTHTRAPSPPSLPPGSEGAAPAALSPPAPAPFPAPAPQRPVAAPPALRPAAGVQPPAAGTGGWSLQPPQALFPAADPAHTPAALGAGWLVVVEGAAGSDPLAGDAGRLLENMLRALQLHHHPRTFACLLDAPPASEAPAPGGLQALQAAVAAVQPAVVLLLGRTAARVLLGRSDPLGRLRAEALQVAGVPTVVSHDAPYLLRAPPQAKALVWADLCRARALAGAPPAA